MSHAFEPIIPDAVYIGGRWHPTDQRFDDVDPSTGEVFWSAPDGSVADMDAAVGAARAAADAGDWARRSIAERAACLTQLAAGIDRHTEELAALAATEWGVAPPTRSLQIDVASHHATDTAALAETALAEGDFGRPEWGISARGMYAPLGVVAAITPWNFPHTINLQKIAPALAAGNTFVLKPSPLSPLAGLALAKIVDEETDIPAGVVNIVTTSTNAPAELLTTDPRVDMVTFVGSAATARLVGAAAAATMKRTLFELGGKSAATYVDDFDVTSIGAQTVIDSCTLHAGQACILHSRVLVHRTAHDAFVDRFAALVDDVVVGDAKDPSTQMGPVIDRRSEERILGMIDQAVADGARIVRGGRRPDGVAAGGNYVEPTVLVDVDPRSAIAQEEVFGPVTCIIAYDDDDHAVRIANDSRYGLVGTVHGTDLDRAERIARRIDTGVVTLNGAAPFGPYGGWKQSGIGREGGVHGIRTYTELRTVTRFG